MSNRHYSDVHPLRNEKDGVTPAAKAKHKMPNCAGSADCKQHPDHDGPEAKGPGKTPKAC